MNVWQGVPVRYRARIQGAIISAWPPVVWIFLRDHVKRRRPTAGGGADDAKLQHMFEFSACDVKSLAEESTRSRRDWRAVGNDVVGHGVLGWYLRVARSGYGRVFCEDGFIS